MIHFVPLIRPKNEQMPKVNPPRKHHQIFFITTMVGKKWVTWKRYAQRKNRDPFCLEFVREFIEAGKVKKK